MRKLTEQSFPESPGIIEAHFENVVRNALRLDCKKQVDPCRQCVRHLLAEEKAVEYGRAVFGGDSGSPRFGKGI